MRKFQFTLFLAATMPLAVWPTTPRAATLNLNAQHTQQTTDPLVIRIHESKPGQYHDYCAPSYKDGCHRHEGNSAMVTKCPEVECSIDPLIEPGLRGEEPKKFEKTPPR